MGNSINKSNISKVTGQLLAVLNTRSKDIISRRFGLKTGRKETLDAIGKSYDITRERVRQIEEVALKQMRSHLESGFDKTVAPYLSLARATLEDHGGTLNEEQLFGQLVGDAKDKSSVAALTLLITLDNQLKHFGETDDLHSFWTLSDKHADNSVKVVSSLVSSFEKHQNPVSENDLFNFYKKSASVNCTPVAFNASLNLAKNISKSIFGEVGLVGWPNVKPRGVRDKAFLVLKRDGKPKHFREITKLINTANFSNRKANVQTVHNELIKDKRFVLIGRGTYGLAEWGYKAGTVRDVLVDLLRSAPKPLAKAELVAQVLSHRMVKENTILLNLQDSKVFKKTDDGAYTLREA